jgi:hypothetical protein
MKKLKHRQIIYEVERLYPRYHVMLAIKRQKHRISSSSSHSSSVVIHKFHQVARVCHGRFGMHHPVSVIDAEHLHLLVVVESSQELGSD